MQNKTVILTSEFSSLSPITFKVVFLKVTCGCLELVNTSFSCYFTECCTDHIPASWAWNATVFLSILLHCFFLLQEQWGFNFFFFFFGKRIRYKLISTSPQAFSGLIPFSSIISVMFLRSQLLSLATGFILLCPTSLQRQIYDMVERVVTQNRVNKLWWHCCEKLAGVKIKWSSMTCEASYICPVCATLQSSLLTPSSGKKLMEKESMYLIDLAMPKTFLKKKKETKSI